MPGGGGRHAEGRQAAGGGRIPVVALGGYGVDASLMSFWLHDGGIHIVWDRRGPVLVMPV
jgi:hypothetical protein